MSVSRITEKVMDTDTHRVMKFLGGVDLGF